MADIVMLTSLLRDFKHDPEWKMRGGGSKELEYVRQCALFGIPLNSQHAALPFSHIHSPKLHRHARLRGVIFGSVKHATTLSLRLLTPEKIKFNPFL